MRSGYDDFDLEIQPAGDGYAVRLLNSPAGQAQGHFAAIFTADEVEKFYLRIGQSHRNTRGTESPATKAAKDFGDRLFRAVLDGHLLTQFRLSQVRAARRNRGIRIRLRLRAVPKLAELPWELLYDKEGDHFIATSATTPVVRYLDLEQSPTVLRVQPPLHILVVISSPARLPKLDTEGEWKKLKSALGKLETSGLVVLERLPSATFAGLRMRARGEPFHILHFIGHGGFDPIACEGVIHFEDDGGMADAITGNQLGNILRDHDSLRLAVLNSCEGARQSNEETFSGVAQALCRQRLPAVIAMQFEISDDAAKTFAEEFYCAVSDGLPVDAAVSEARKALSLPRFGHEWATPVLYMRSPSGMLFQLKRSKAAVRPIIEAAAPEPVIVITPTNADKRISPREQIVRQSMVQKAVKKSSHQPPIKAVALKRTQAPKAPVKIKNKVPAKKVAKSPKKLPERKVIAPKTPGQRPSPKTPAPDQKTNAKRQKAAAAVRQFAIEQKRTKDIETEYKLAVDEHNHSHYARAREMFLKLANLGHVDSMEYLGIYAQRGLARTQDFTEAASWYRKAAGHGSAYAKNALGTFYYNGTGVGRDYKLARYWLQEAAAGGEATAHTHLGWIYQNGEGVTRDYGKARELYLKGAEAGDAVAMRRMAELYREGKGVGQSDVNAKVWLQKAAIFGDDIAEEALKVQQQDGQLERSVVAQRRQREIREQAILEILHNWVRTRDFHVAPNIPALKLKNLSEKCKLSANEKVLGLIDNTIMGSARDGILFCVDRMYWNYTFTSHKADYDNLSLEHRPLAGIRVNGEGVDLSGSNVTSAVLYAIIRSIISDPRIVPP